MAEIDEEIIRIQKSTRTLFKSFIPVHEGLRLKYKWYYKWHLWRGINVLHWAILILSIFGIVEFSFLSLQTTRPMFVKAATTWTVVGATGGYNGTYTESGTWKGKPYYVYGSGADTRYLYWNPDYNAWVLFSYLTDVYPPVCDYYGTIGQELPANPWSGFLPGTPYVTTDHFFGYAAAGSNIALPAPEGLRGSVFDLNESGTVSAIYAYLSPGTCGFYAKAAIYRHSDGALIASSNPVAINNCSGPQWYQFPVTANISADDYVLAILVEYGEGYGPGIHYDAGSTNQGHFQSATYPSLPNPLSATHDTNKYSIYALYTPLSVPAAPTIGTPEAISTTTIRWKFTDNANNETGFRVYDSGGNLRATCASPNLSYCDETGLSANTQYSGRYVVAYNDAGESAHSGTAASIYTLIEAPSGLATSNITSTSITVTVQGSFTNLGFGLSAIRYCNITASVCAPWQTNTDAYTFDNLNPSTTYTFTAQARNGDGITTTTVSTSETTLSAGEEAQPPEEETKPPEEEITPPKPYIYLVISPESATIQPYQTQQYSVDVYNQDKEKVDAQLTWSLEQDIGTISENGLFTAGNIEGNFHNAIKVSASYQGLSTFGFASVVIQKEPPKLSHLANSWPSRTFTENGDRFLICATPKDQYGNQFNSANRYINFSILDSNAASFQKTSNRCGYIIPKKVGCYPFVIKSEVNYNGIYLYALSSIRVEPSVKEGNGDPRQLSNLEIGPRKLRFSPGESVNFIVGAWDQYQSRIINSEFSYNFTVTNPDAGTITPNGYFVAGNKLGTYPNAIKLTVSFGSKTKTLERSVIIENLSPRRISNFRGYSAVSEGYVFAKPNRYFFLYYLPTDQYGDDYNKDYQLSTATLDPSIGELQNRFYLKTGSKEGEYFNAITLVGYNEDKTRFEKKLNLIIKSNLPEDICNFNNPYGSEPRIKPPKSSDFFDNLLISSFESLKFIGGSSVTFPVALGLSLMIALGQILSALPHLSTFFNFLLNLKNNLFTWLGIRKRRNRWGVIFDDYSKKPLAYGRVLVYTYPDMRLRESTVTNSLGEFGFLVPEGKYQLHVKFPNYHQLALPKGVKGSRYIPNRNDAYYNNLYYKDEVITLMSEEEEKAILDISVPLVPDKQIMTFGKKILHSWHSLMKFINKIHLPLLIIGSVLALLTLIYRHHIIDWILIGLYGLFWILEIYNFLYKARTFGKVVDKNNQTPLDLVLIRLIDSKTGKIRSTFVTGKDGRFTFSVPAGIYTISAVKEGYEPLFTRAFAVKSLTKFGKLNLNMKPSEKWKKELDIPK